ncbi:hypothetical protein IFM89_035454 [Coptis chinensis]|uniref:Ribonuclease H1 N-terminal domain-containing protein n=1 Tax=Coptis chinensis TaxID=261450 RepID=A0A835IZG4_9MAGN|nr:hypothetical protein IFM89_035454 [Coptis chinensis]
MAKLCYAVIRGWQPGIYKHWSSCRDQVQKFAVETYIGCNSIKEVELLVELLLRKKGINNYYNEFNQTLEETTEQPIQPILTVSTTIGETCMQTEHNSQSVLLRNMALVIIGLLVVLIALMVRLILLL